jgi:predicted ArsR family transcriptional regulator
MFPSSHAAGFRALLEALWHAGTLTATQAGEMLGETPANCAFHLRTLARYGLAEEAGGGKGRERPWRRVALTAADPDALRNLIRAARSPAGWPSRSQAG